MVAHNNQIANAHFKKDWQGNTTSCRVRTWFNQAGRYVDPATSARFLPASPASRARLLDSMYRELSQAKRDAALTPSGGS